MTYTFKLSRRLASLRALPLLGAVLISAACGAGTPAEPGNDGPDEGSPPGMAISPDSALVGTGSEIQFGMTSTSPDLQTSAKSKPPKRKTQRRNVR